MSSKVACTPAIPLSDLVEDIEDTTSGLEEISCSLLQKPSVENLLTNRILTHVQKSKKT